MTKIIKNVEMLGQRIVSLCHWSGNNEMMYEQQVKEWVEFIPPNERPTPEGVLMNAKRKLWGLESMLCR